MGKYVDRTGQKFGRLLVQSDTGLRANGGSVVWRCLCDCGNQKNASGSSLVAMQTQSCGCWFIEVAREKGLKKKIHGMTRTTEYRTWSCMKSRCYNDQDKKWDRYGGRGIKIQHDWIDSFEAFYRDMGPKPRGMTIDRINTNGDYTKDNCRWATQKTQQNNRTNNKILVVNGEAMTMQLASEKYGISSDKVQQRLKRGWTEMQALSLENHIRKPCKI
jgi:hypothetical protein